MQSMTLLAWQDNAAVSIGGYVLADSSPPTRCSAHTLELDELLLKPAQ